MATLSGQRSLTRLQKILSTAGVASRRAAERLMEQGRVTVNGRVVTTLGTRADPDRDDIRVDGRRVGKAQRRRYVLLNKPRGYITTRHDPQRRRTVLDLIPRVREYVYPVGRLDYDSEGLLLLTNDGELAEQLIHPRHGLERVYEAIVQGVPSVTQIRRLTSGILLEGRYAVSTTARLLGGQSASHNDRARVRITLLEGRNRQVRRMFDEIGHPVIRLRRIRLGPLSNRGLSLGHHRELSCAEVATLRRAAISHPNASTSRLKR